MEGIERTEISRRKAAEECLRSAWPSDQKGAHQVKDCIRKIKLDNGTAAFSEAKQHLKQSLPDVDSEDELPRSENSVDNSGEERTGSTAVDLVLD
jgi:hypothetical protein